MKLTVHRENLQRALGIVERVTIKNAALPILSNVLLKTERGRLTISATNLEIGVTADIGAKIDSDGHIAVPGRILSDLTRAAKSDTVTFSTQQNTLLVEAGKYRTSILSFDAAEYPIIPRITENPIVSVPGSILHKLFSCAAGSIAMSDARPELAGAYMRFSPDLITVAATDSFRLAESVVSVAHSADISCIIPRATVTELVRILGDSDSDVAIRITDNQIVFASDEFTIVSRRIDGQYPDYQKVIPEHVITKALVHRDGFEQAIKAVAVFSSTISDMKLECTNGRISVSARNASTGDGQNEIEANTKGEPFEVTLNYHYLLDGLSVMPTENIILEFTGKGSPFVLRPSNDDKLVYLIMPLRN